MPYIESYGCAEARGGIVMAIKTELKCDCCGAVLALNGPYQIVKDEMKAKGWKNRKNGDAWEIVCPDCLKAGK